MGNAKTTEFLKECLADALIKLLKNKSIEKITIPEIAETAEVGRTTFFRNFTSKSEMITFKLAKLWERWAADYGLTEKEKFSLESTTEFFKFNYSIKELFVLIYQRDLRATVYDAFYKVMLPRFGTVAQGCYQSRFYSYGLFGLLDEWIKRKFNETPEQMAKITQSIVADIKKMPLD